MRDYVITTGIRRWVTITCMMMLLSGCLLQSAREETVEPYQAGLQHRVTFYRSDTNGEWAEQEIDVDTMARTLDLQVYARAQTGDLEIQILEANEKREAFTIKATKDGERQQQIIRTDDVGNIHYRIRAANAFNGEYVISYQPPPTPTPTPTPTPSPSPSPTAEVYPLIPETTVVPTP